MSESPDAAAHCRRLEERLRVFSDSTRAFAEATPDLQRLLEVVARRVAEVVKDCCLVLLLSDDGTTLVPAAMFDPDPEALRQIREMLSHPFLLEAHSLARHVVESGEPFLAARLDLDELRPPRTTPRFFEFMGAVGIHSMLIVAMRVHDRSIGQLTLARFRPDSPPFDEHDLALAQGLADQAALAVSNARLLWQAKAQIGEMRQERAADAIFRRLLESAPDAMVIVGSDGAIVLINGQAETLFGYARTELMGKPVEVLIPRRRACPSQGAGHPSVLRGVPCEAILPVVGGLEQYGRRKDGTDFPIEVRLSPLQTSDGWLLSRAIRDITERKRAEADLGRAMDAAEAANRELEAFSYSVAHDLRAPLRGMNGFAQLLVDTYPDKIDAEGQEFLQEILQNAKKMGDLIDGLLSLARVTRSGLNLERIDLSQLVRETATRLSASEPHRAVQFAVRDHLLADVDPRLARALCENLLGNAWKFTSKVASPCVEFGFTEKDGAHAFFVRDNGAGFDMDFAGKLFAPFQRLHTADEFAGTGIGLATVQRIVHRHGGRIWANGKVDGGAIFYFTFATRVSGAAP